MAQSESMKNEDDKEERHRYHRRHHKRHYHRMRMHDHNVRNLIDNDFDIPQACACDPVADPLMPPEALGAWGTVVQNCRVPKIKKPNLKKSGRTYGSAGSQKGTFARDRDAFQEEDNFRFQHYKDISSYIKQYREENTICIQGEDPCGPPVLGKDTPDPYFSKLSQCGDLWERLMAFTRDQGDDGNQSRDPSFMRVVQQAKIHSAPSLTLSSDLQLRGQVPRKAINLAPVRDCRVAVKTINFPHAAPPKRQPTHIPQLQQQQQQTNTSQTPNLPDIPSAKVSFPWPVRIVVNSDTLKGNKLTSLTPPQSPSKSGRPLERSESVDRQLHAHYRISKRAITKKRSEGDIRQPLCSTATATDFSITDPNIYQQFLAQQRRFNKAAAAGNLFFSNNSQSNSGPSVKSDKKEDGKPPISLCEAYSSASLITAVNKG